MSHSTRPRPVNAVQHLPRQPQERQRASHCHRFISPERTAPAHSMRHRMKAELVDFFYVYDTPRTVVVRDKKVGITFRLIQLGVLCYIVGWVFIYEKGYQSEDSPISSISVKLKGIALVDVPGQGSQLLDPADYVFPPEGDNDFVVMTNFIVTPNQTQGICAEERPQAQPSALQVTIYTCNDDVFENIFFAAILKTCPNIAESSDLLRGVMTGRCISFDNTTKTCEVHAWCPIENDSDVPKPPLLLKAENFTLYLKNSISFPRFGATRRNLVESVTSNHLLTCVFDKNTDPLCPVMRLGYMVKESGQNFTDIAYKGGTVGVIIDWQCDLDWARKFCAPTYTFIGLDDPVSNVSKGFNFRYAKYYVENGVNKRSLYKVFGIRFAVMVSGKAGKFDIIPTMTTIGSGIGIFGVATVVCDLMLLHVIPRRHYYKKRKFKSALEDSQKPTGKKDCDVPCNSFQGDHEEKEHPESTSSAET